MQALAFEVNACDAANMEMLFLIFTNWFVLLVVDALGFY